MHSPKTTKNIRRLYELHKGYGKVSKLLNIPRETVARIVKRCDDKPKLKRGPLKLISNRDNTLIKKTVRNSNAIGARCTARKLQMECNLQHVSKRTIQRHVKTLKFNYKSATKMIELSKKQISATRICQTLGETKHKLATSGFY